MTTGSLWKNIFMFSLPLMLTQVLEVLFNLSDVAVAGKFADYIALGAVGSTTILVTLYTGFLIGMGAGVNVRVAHKLGMEDAEGTRKMVHSSLMVCLITGLFMCFACMLLARPMLVLLKTKEELLDSAVLYLQIYSLGMPAMAVYNFGNGVLSACGETKRPLLYLSVAGIVNVMLNLFFVIVCGRAADGVAIASVISQYLSVFLILGHLFRRKDSCRLTREKGLIDRHACKEVLVLGIPAGIQNAIFAIANLFVQSGVNHFDAITVSGNSGKRDRIMKSYLISLLYAFLTGAILGGLLLLFGRQFLWLFADDPGVVQAGLERIKIMGWSYAIGAFMDCTIAASRGLGKSIVPTVVVILGSCVFRVIWVYTVFAYYETIPSLYLLYSFSWTITAIAEIIYFLACYRKLKRQQAT